MHRVSRSLYNSVQIRFVAFARYLYWRSGILLRLLLCWSIGCLFLNFDEHSNFDQRLAFRGNQSKAKDVVVIKLKPSDFSQAYSLSKNNLRELKEIADITDSFYWNKQIWLRLLEKTLSAQPKAIGVTLFFGDNIGSHDFTQSESNVFFNQKVFWSFISNQLEKPLPSKFTNQQLSNVGSNEITKDEDGVVRRITYDKIPGKHLAEKVTNKNFPIEYSSILINFRGDNQVFEQFSLQEVLSEKFKVDQLKDKVILISTTENVGGNYSTPLGNMSRGEIIAHLTDNLLSHRWVIKLPYWTYCLIYFLLTALAAFVIMQYPQSVVIIFFVWIGTLAAALSALTFDKFYLWMPGFSPFLLLAATWIIFIGYQATKIERHNFKLKQDQKAMRELEQLKTNFVSLISHDLKTPIAKIQSIVSRLKIKNQDPALQEDISKLQSYNEELNRYIQSILQVLKVESRDFKLNKEVADINEIIESATSQLLPLAQEKNITITSSLEPIFSLEFDVTLIKEVLINLIENAIKYTPANGHISIESIEKDDYIWVKVKDTGEGIPADEINAVWNKFVRGKEQELKTKGTGLGLYLVKFFIELHNGHVQLESQLGKGTQVSFTLPVNE